LPSSSSANGAGDGATREDDALVLANEFAEVTVRKVNTRNGVRLEVVAPKLGRRIRLCPVELEALTWQNTATFSAMIGKPFGPLMPDDDE
jgi:hypothetical protein